MLARCSGKRATDKTNEMIIRLESGLVDVQTRQRCVFVCECVCAVLTWSIDAL